MASPSLLVLDDAHHVGLTAAELVANRIRARRRARVLLPTGHTPRGLYAALRDHAADGSLPSEDLTVLGLDEYLGLGADDPRSFRASLDGELAGIPIGRREALDGAAADPEAEAARYESVLDTAPVDLAVLGLGRDAHVAFNEPGSRPGDGVRRVALDPSTIEAAAADFGGADRVPPEALTVGPRTLLAARELLLIVTGAEKAAALHEALEGPIGPDAPASLLRGHPCLTVLCDRAAAARLRPAGGRESDHVAIVLGHREPGSQRGAPHLRALPRAPGQRGRPVPADAGPRRAAHRLHAHGRPVGGRADGARVAAGRRAVAPRGGGPQHRGERVTLACRSSWPSA